MKKKILGILLVSCLIITICYINFRLIHTEPGYYKEQNSLNIPVELVKLFFSPGEKVTSFNMSKSVIAVYYQGDGGVLGFGNIVVRQKNNNFWGKIFSNKTLLTIRNTPPDKVVLTQLDAHKIQVYKKQEGDCLLERTEERKKECLEKTYIVEEK